MLFARDRGQILVNREHARRSLGSALKRELVEQRAAFPVDVAASRPPGQVHRG
jgi:hypothetical protein